MNSIKFPVAGLILPDETGGIYNMEVFRNVEDLVRDSIDSSKIMLGSFLW